MFEKIKGTIKNLELKEIKWVDVEKLDFVEVKKYEGIVNSEHTWTFLGYDYVEKVDKKGKSITLDNVIYKYLEGIGGLPSDNPNDCYNIKIGDIRIKSIPSNGDNDVFEYALQRGNSIIRPLYRLHFSRDVIKEYLEVKRLSFETAENVEYVKKKAMGDNRGG